MKRLEAGGIDRDQAEAHAEAINDYVRPDLATTDDPTQLRTELRADMVAMEQRITAAIASIRQDIAQRETRMIGVIAAMLGLLFSLLAPIKFFA